MWKQIYNLSWNNSELNLLLLFLNLIFQPNKPNPLTVMQNVFSVNASNKIKRFQSDDLAGLFLSKPFNIHRMFCVLVPMTWSIGTRSCLKIHNDREKYIIHGSHVQWLNSTQKKKKKKNLCYNSHKILYHNDWDNNECDFL